MTDDPGRRRFIRLGMQAGLAVPLSGLLGRSAFGAPSRMPGLLGRPAFPDPRIGWRGDSSVAAAAGSKLPTPAAPGPMAPTLLGRLSPPTPLAERFSDLRRHLVFDYYPWYGADPVVHWDQWGRVPPHDIAASTVPRLGAYDSRSRAVLEAHARWIADSGAGAVNLSWWGPGSFEDRTVSTVMDVFRDRDLKVTFHLEPYANDRAARYVEDVLYLLREYGEKRHFDAFLVLGNADGTEGPVFKSFRTILPAEFEDCRGVRRRVADYTPDRAWRRETDRLRDTLRGEFHHLTLLADSLDFTRTTAAGFDGIAIYDNFVPPSSYAGHGAGASSRNLVFSFNVNPGYDAIEPREADQGECYSPTPFAPPSDDLDFGSPSGVARAASLSAERIAESFAATVAVQTDPTLQNARRGFFLAYLTSFNEWHEGHAFEPMKDRGQLTREERAFGYHNPDQGDYRLTAVTRWLRTILAPAPAPTTARS